MDAPVLMSELGPPDMLLMSDDGDKKPLSSGVPDASTEPSVASTMSTVPSTAADEGTTTTVTEVPLSTQTDISSAQKTGNESLTPAGLTTSTESETMTASHDTAKDNAVPVETGVGSTEAAASTPQTEKDTSQNGLVTTNDLHKEVDSSPSVHNSGTTTPASTQETPEGPSTDSQEVSFIHVLGV